MNEYMAENKIEAVPPPAEAPKAEAPEDDAEAAADSGEKKPAKVAKVTKKGD